LRNNSNGSGRNNDKFKKGIELGDYERPQGKQMPAEVSDDLRKSVPFTNPYFRSIDIALNEDTQNEWDNHSDDEESRKQIEKKILAHIPSSGWLGLSADGDFALIKRLRKQLKQLRDQSGYAPFLSSYLFDIKSANVPAELLNITDWMNTTLNEDQKETEYQGQTLKIFP